MLEIRPETFRKRLSLARKEVRSFLAPRCGWIDSNNDCRCARQVGYDVKVGWVERGNLKYADGKRSRNTPKIDSLESSMRYRCIDPTRSTRPQRICRRH